MKKLLIFLLALTAYGQTRGTSTSVSNFTSGAVSSQLMPGTGSWNVTTGNTIVACISYNGNNNLTVTDTASNTYTNRGYATRPGFADRVAMFTADNVTGSSTDVLTIHFPSNDGTFIGAVATQYSGTATSAIDANVVTGQANATSITSPSFTTVQGPEMVVACGAFADSGQTAGNVGTTPMSIAITESPVKSIAMEDANVYQIQTGVTASMSTTSGAELSRFVTVSLKSSNPTSPPIGRVFLTSNQEIQGVPYIYSGGTTTISFLISNPNTATTLNGVAFSLTLPTNLVVSTPSGATGTCNGGTFTATQGTSSISLTGGSLTASANCTLFVNLTSTGAGQGQITTGQFTSTTSGAGIGPTASNRITMFGTSTYTISGAATDTIAHSSLHISYTISSPGYCQVNFGTVTGVYSYTSGIGTSNGTSCTLSLGGLNPVTQYFISPTVVGTPTTSPWLANVCQVAGSCGSSEITATTLAEPTPHPALPATAATWTPAEPDTSAYTLVTMFAATTSGTDTGGKTYAIGDCVAQNTVIAPVGGHWTSNVTANDTYITVLGEIWYDVVIEHAKGSSCNIPQYTGVNGKPAGVNIPHYSVAGGPSDWLVIRTHQTSNNDPDFPPFGVRTGPQFAAKLASLVATTPGMPIKPGITSYIGSPNQNFNGQIFDCQTGCNHIWIKNLEMTHVTNTTLYPVGVVNQPIFTNSVQFKSSDCSGNECLLTDPTKTPDHIVLDRIYNIGQPYPAIENGCFYPGGTNWAIINTYCSISTTLPAVWPQSLPIVSGANITVPVAYYDLNLLASSPKGMTTGVAYYTEDTTSEITMGTGTFVLTVASGLSWTGGQLVEMQATPVSGQRNNTDLQHFMIGTVTTYSGTSLTVSMTSVTGSGKFGPAENYKWAIQTPAAVAFSGVSTYTGQVIAWVDAGGLTIDFQTSGGVSATCTNIPACTVQHTFSTPFDQSTTFIRSLVPATSMFLFWGTFDGAGNFTVSESTASNETPSLNILWRPQGMYFTAFQYGIYDNNFMGGAIGQTVYNDTAGTSADLIFTHNLIYFPRSMMQSDPSWDGYGYTYRNVIESKQLTRANFAGNIFDGSAAFQNPGNVLYFAGSVGGSFSTGIQDVTIASNVMRHISTGFQIAGGGTSSPAMLDPPSAARIRLTNNFLLDLNRDIYSNGGGGLASGPFAAYPLSQDLIIDGNTVGRTRGGGPAIFEFGGSSVIGTTIMGEGLKIANNVILTNLGGLDVFASIDGGQYKPNFPSNPVIPPFTSAPAPVGTWQAALDGNFLRSPGGGITTSNWSMGNNIIVGGEGNRNSTSTWGDLSPTDISNLIKPSWPAPDTTTIFPCYLSDPLCSGGTTFASRLQNIGWGGVNLTSGNINNYPLKASKYQAGNLGAFTTSVNQATGTVQNILVATGPSSIQFTYAAPDSRTCYVDVSPNGTTWTRSNDAGGSFARTLLVTSLSASTTYQYRLMCYFDQTSAFEFTPGQITTGSTTTNPVASKNLNYSFVFPVGATKVNYSYTPLVGSPVTGTCSSSPCIVALASGTWNFSNQFQTSGSVNVGSPATGSVNLP